MASKGAQKFILDGLDCANCAAKIEVAVQRETGLSEAGINFSTRSIFIPPEFAPQVQQIIDRIEPGVKLVAATTLAASAAGNGLPLQSHPGVDVLTGAHGRGLTQGRSSAVGYDHSYRHGVSRDQDTGHVHDYDLDSANSHSHRHHHAHGQNALGTRRLIEIGIAAALFVVGLFFYPQLQQTPYSIGEYLVFLPAYWLVGRGVVGAAFRNLRRGEFFDENSLMTIATIGAILIRELPEAVGVMLFYSVGEAFQDYAVDRSRRSIAALMDIRPDYANIRRNGKTHRVSPEEVGIGDEIVVRPGEKIPLDGDVIEGSSFVDTSALSGESVPRQVEPGGSVLAGMVNTSGLLVIRVTRPFGESSVAKILELVEHAGARKARTEKFITRFSRYYTPAVVLAALGVAVLPPLFFEGAQLSEWTYRALVLLVISCPCALVLSIPVGYFGGIGGASRQGILVKGANFLDALTTLDTVVMDKTGTLTQGVFKVTRVTTYNGFTEREVLHYAAHAESFSHHPIAVSIGEAYDGQIDEALVENYEEIAGHGVIARIDGKVVVAGNDRMLHRESIPHERCDAEGTVVNVAVDGVLAGQIIIADEIKEDAADAIRSLRALGVSRTVMLTGDDKDVAQRVGDTLGIDEVHGGLLPEEKVQALERIAQERARSGTIAFVGDGINDAPVLTRADVGIAMGGLGQDAAIEAADVVVMDDRPSKIGKAIAIARRTRTIVLQNIVFALGVKIAVIVLGTMGMANMWEAVFADVGVSLLAVLNATRALRT